MVVVVVVVMVMVLSVLHIVLPPFLPAFLYMALAHNVHTPAILFCVKSGTQCSSFTWPWHTYLAHIPAMALAHNVQTPANICILPKCVNTKKGEELCVTYVDLLSHSSEQQHQLRHQYFFDTIQNSTQNDAGEAVLSFRPSFTFLPSVRPSLLPSVRPSVLPSLLPSLSFLHFPCFPPSFHPYFFPFFRHRPEFHTR
jgi:hypothetical protein